MAPNKNSHGLAFVFVTISALLLTLTYVANAKAQPTMESPPPMEAVPAMAPMAEQPMTAPRPFDPAPMTPVVSVSEPTMEPVMAVAPMVAPTVAPMVPVPMVAPTANLAAIPPEGYPDDELMVAKAAAEEAAKKAAEAKAAKAEPPPATVATATTVEQPKATVSAAEKKDNWWQTLLGGLLQLILLFIAGIATPLGVLLVKYVAKKSKIADAETLEVLNGLYDCAIDAGIHFATQMANKLNNNPDAKAQRIKWATDRAISLIKDWELPEKSGKWIEDAIETRLGLMNGSKPVDTTQPVKSEEDEETTPVDKATPTEEKASEKPKE